MLRKGWLDLWTLVALIASLCAIGAIARDMRFHAMVIAANPDGRYASMLMLTVPLVALALMGCALAVYRRRAAAQVEINPEALHPLLPRAHRGRGERR